MMATNYLAAMDPGINGVNGFLVLSCQSDGKEITEYEIKTMTSVTPATPTTPLAPTRFDWPIALLRSNPRPPNGGPTTYTAYRLTGCSSLIAVVRETGRHPVSPATPSDPGYESYYTWTVGNFLDPTFIVIKEDS
jgi:hypothetical protein